MTWQELVIEVIKNAGRPLKRKEIYESISIIFPDVQSDVIGQTLYIACQRGFLVKVEMDNSPSYYARPEWCTKKGKLKRNLNLIWGDTHDSKQI